MVESGLDGVLLTRVDFFSARAPSAWRSSKGGKPAKSLGAGLQGRHRIAFVPFVSTQINPGPQTRIYRVWFGPGPLRRGRVRPLSRRARSDSGWYYSIL